ncbi:DM4/DM12 domain-containing protein Desiccate [Haematobia irritans]|uniref:DM4/DM12 domain-containing protein Desiccate n=1 Tax=Haematobia irritans TaxID=7368 RepID=UPI003F4FD10B
MFLKYTFGLHVIVYTTLFVYNNASAVPKFETGNGKSRIDKSEWGRSYYKENITQNSELDNTSTKDRLQRLGYTTGYGTINTYSGGTGLASYNPIKLDLGGVVLGTLVGIGAIIIIPKILNAFHGGYGGYGRSENDLSPVSHFINRIDDILGQNQIDSTSCMQRAVCSYVRSTEHNMMTGKPDQMDELIHILSENSLVDYLLDGTAIKEALERGRNMNMKPCDHIYNNCPIDSEVAAKILTKLVPKQSES